MSELALLPNRQREESQAQKMDSSPSSTIQAQPTVQEEEIEEVNATNNAPVTKAPEEVVEVKRSEFEKLRTQVEEAHRMLNQQRMFMNEQQKRIEMQEIARQAQEIQRKEIQQAQSQAQAQASQAEKEEKKEGMGGKLEKVGEKKSKSTMVVIIIIVTLLVIAVMVYMYMRRKRAAAAANIEGEDEPIEEWDYFLGSKRDETEPNLQYRETRLSRISSLRGRISIISERPRSKGDELYEPSQIDNSLCSARSWDMARIPDNWGDWANRGICGDDWDEEYTISPPLERERV